MRWEIYEGDEVWEDILKRGNLLVFVGLAGRRGEHRGWGSSWMHIRILSLESQVAVFMSLSLTQVCLGLGPFLPCIWSHGFGELQW